jgi:hypothetical protein
MAADFPLRTTVSVDILYFFINVPDEESPLASGVSPAREAESAGGMPKVPKGQGLGRLAR